MKKNRRIWIALEIAILVIFIGNIVYQGKHLDIYDMDLSQWQFGIYGV